MARSPFYARIKRDVLAILAVVPEGRLVTFTDAGRHLDVSPRHVAYILATLDAAEADGCRGTAPWPRAAGSIHQGSTDSAEARPSASPPKG